MPYNPPTHRSDESAKLQAIHELLDHSSHSKNFYILLIGAIVMAIGGIFTDSLLLLIASMIVAPLAFPILTLGLGIAVADGRLIVKTLGVLLVGCLLTLGLSMIATLIFGDLRADNVYVTFTGSLLLSFAVALVSGAIAAYGTLQPKIASALTGIAIAVSLLPPLVATGVGIASGDVALTINGASIFGLNILGVLIASILIFVGVRIIREYKTIK